MCVVAVCVWWWWCVGGEGQACRGSKRYLEGAVERVRFNVPSPRTAAPGPNKEREKKRKTDGGVAVLANRCHSTGQLGLFLLGERRTGEDGIARRLPLNLKSPHGRGNQKKKKTRGSCMGTAAPLCPNGSLPQAPGAGEGVLTDLATDLYLRHPMRARGSCTRSLATRFTTCTEIR